MGHQDDSNGPKIVEFILRGNFGWICPIFVSQFTPRSIGSFEELCQKKVVITLFSRGGSNNRHTRYLYVDNMEVSRISNYLEHLSHKKGIYCHNRRLNICRSKTPKPSCKEFLLKGRNNKQSRWRLIFWRWFQGLNRSWEFWSWMGRNLRPWSFKFWQRESFFSMF